MTEKDELIKKILDNKLIQNEKEREQIAEKLSLDDEELFIEANVLIDDLQKKLKTEQDKNERMKKNQPKIY